MHLLGVALPEATLHTARGTGWTCSDRGLPGNVGTPADPVKLAQSVWRQQALSVRGAIFQSLSLAKHCGAPAGSLKTLVSANAGMPSGGVDCTRAHACSKLRGAYTPVQRTRGGLHRSGTTCRECAMRICLNVRLGYL